jgi:hypothetical protein
MGLRNRLRSWKWRKANRNKVLGGLCAHSGCAGGAKSYILCALVGESGKEWGAGHDRRFVV